LRDACAPERVEHEVATLVGQRVFGIALGHEDSGGRFPDLRAMTGLRRDYRKFRVWDRTMLLKELSYAAPQTAFYPG
jgi:hypothetical protein